MKLELGKDDMMNMLLYECWMSFACIVCMNMTSLDYVISIFDVDV